LSHFRVHFSFAAHRLPRLGRELGLKFGDRALELIDEGMGCAAPINVHTEKRCRDDDCPSDG